MRLACVTLFDHTSVWGYLPFPTDPVRVKSNACAAVRLYLPQVCKDDRWGFLRTCRHPGSPKSALSIGEHLGVASH